MIFKAGGFKSYQLTVIVVNSLYKTVAKEDLKLATNAAITKNLALFIEPIGTIISTLWIIYDIIGPAYKVTIPGIVMIAMLRKEYEQRKFKLQNRLKKLVENRIYYFYYNYYDFFILT